jgi:protein-disulfide isomerase
VNLRRALAPLALLAVACGGPVVPAPAPPVALTTPVASSAPPSAVVQDAPVSEEEAAVPVSTRNPTWGSRLAPVTVVEFADLQCPYSKKVQVTLSALRESYGPDKLRIVWKNNPLPFHVNAAGAAEAAMGVFVAAGRDAFWKFHDLAFASQTSLSRDQYVQWAEQAGVSDSAAYSAGLDGHQWTFVVEEDRHQAATLGATGTPAFFINGVFLSGAQPIDAFKAIIDDQLLKAKARLDAGTPPDRLYARLAAEGRAADAAKPPRKDSDDDHARTVFKIPLGKSPVRGPPTALVTIVEFADFQCPFSARVQPTLDALRAEYADKLRIVWRNEPLPFHKAAEPAAEAAVEVRDEKGDAAFWDLHDRLFASQKSLIQGDAPDLDFIADAATSAGGNRVRVRMAIAGRTHKADIVADGNLADDFAATGTPTFFIDGRRLVGAQPKETFEKIIDEEIGKAQALVTQGVRPVDVYAALTRDGSGPVEPEKRDLPNPLPAGDPARGAAGARVAVHEWADFQCPFCGREEPTVQQIVKDYAGRIRVVWHDLPLPMHALARKAAEAAREALAQKGVKGFWDMHDILFTNQAHLERVDLDGYAVALHLDATRWAAALDGDLHESDIAADEKAAGVASIRGTPAFMVVARGTSRGYFLSGAQDARLRRLIDRALTEVK